MRMAVVRGLTSLFAVAVAVAACGQTGTNAQTSVSGAERTQARGDAPASSETMTLEFDVSNEFRAQPSGSANAVTGFRVGYFRGSDSTPLRTLDVARDAVNVRGRTARVALPRNPVPGCGSDCVIRVQTLAGNQASAWSEPVALSGASVGRQAAAPAPPPSGRPRTANPDRSAAAAQDSRQRGGLAPGDIGRYTALSEALRTLLPADASLEAELARFRRVEDLALVVALSREYDIPFATLSQAISGPPRTSPRDALATLRKDLAPRDAIRKARAEARKLTEAQDAPGARPPQ